MAKTLSEQVRDLEAERDAAVRRAEEAERRVIMQHRTIGRITAAYDSAEQRVADAKREGARDFAEKLSAWLKVSRTEQDESYAAVVDRFFAHEYFGAAAPRSEPPTEARKCGADEGCAECGHLRGSHIANGKHPEQVPCWAFTDTNKHCACPQFVPAPSARTERVTDDGDLKVDINEFLWRKLPEQTPLGEAENIACDLYARIAALRDGKGA